jgi:hypothetical protein
MTTRDCMWSATPLTTGLVIGRASGLPWSGAGLLHAWVIVGVVVWVLGVFRVRAAQLGWVGYVAATTAMTYAGAARPSAAIAAGIVVTAAVVLSIPVARRGGNDPDVVVVPPDPDQRVRRRAPVADTVAEPTVG